MADNEEGEGSARAVVDDDQSPENLEDNLSFLDKLKCMMYSKVERDAFLIEKLEKEEKKKAKAAKKARECCESDSSKKDKPGFFGKMKTVFSPSSKEEGEQQESLHPRTTSVPTEGNKQSQETSSVNESSIGASGGSHDVGKPQ